MTKEELEQEKKNNQDLYREVTSNVALMEQTIEIQNYLDELERVKQEEKRHRFLDSLAIGEDGTVFGSRGYTEYATNTLEEFIKYACSLKYYDKKSQEQHYMKLTFKEMIDYDNNARKVLRKMKKYPDEECLENPYNLEIYPNPKEMQTCAEATLLRDCIFSPSNFSLSRELFIRRIKGVEEINKALIINPSRHSSALHTNFSLDFQEFEPIDISSLSMREQEAFFGKSAQEILGVTIDETLFTKPQEGTIQKRPLTK